jgi:hypothetical protein
MKPIKITAATLTIAVLSAISTYAATTNLDNFTSIKAWGGFNGPKSKAVVTQVDGSVAGSKAMSVKLSNQDWAGVGIAFSPKKQFKITDKLSFSLKLDKIVANNKIRLELTDNKGQRFEYLIPTNYTGNKNFSVALKEFKRRMDWQPAGAPISAMVLTRVEGISFSLVANGSLTMVVENLNIESI